MKIKNVYELHLKEKIYEFNDKIGNRQVYSILF